MMPRVDLSGFVFEILGFPSLFKDISFKIRNQIWGHFGGKKNAS